MYPQLSGRSKIQRDRVEGTPTTTGKPVGRRTTESIYFEFEKNCQQLTAFTYDLLILKGQSTSQFLAISFHLGTRSPWYTVNVP